MNLKNAKSIQRKHQRAWSEEPQITSIDTDNSDGDHPVLLSGQILHDGQYKVVEYVGQGVFGHVVHCIDLNKQKNVAVKITRKNHFDGLAALEEVTILGRLNKVTSDFWRGAYANLLEHFVYQDHLCLVFDLFGLSLYDFMHKKNASRAFLPKTVQTFALQLFAAVAWLHAHNVIHTDIKPDNIVLRNSECSTLSLGAREPLCCDIVLIDLGSAVFASDPSKTHVISARAYRAPEVILGKEWSFATDIWSTACVLTELLSGDVLFPVDHNVEHLVHIDRILGGVDNEHVLRACRKWCKRGKSDASCFTLATFKDNFDISFYDLIKTCLAFDPAARATAIEALQSSYIMESNSLRNYIWMLPPIIRNKGTQVVKVKVADDDHTAWYISWIFG
jgi:serine/threonine protein kinase